MRLPAGGFLAACGVRLALGCTAGHGICDMASLQLPSLVAVRVSPGTAIGVAHLVSWLGGA